MSYLRKTFLQVEWLRFDSHSLSLFSLFLYLLLFDSWTVNVLKEEGEEEWDAQKVHTTKVWIREYPSLFSHHRECIVILRYYTLYTHSHDQPQVDLNLNAASGVFQNKRQKENRSETRFQIKWRWDYRWYQSYTCIHFLIIHSLSHLLPPFFFFLFLTDEAITFSSSNNSWMDDKREEK